MTEYSFLAELYPLIILNNNNIIAYVFIDKNEQNELGNEKHFCICLSIEGIKH